MVKLDDNDKTFIRDNLADADALITSDNVRDVLRLIYDLIDEKGFAPPDYYEYNDFGRKAQRVYDNIFINNATEEELATKLQPIMNDRAKMEYCSTQTQGEGGLI